VYDRCLRTGREYTGVELVEAVNKELASRGIPPISTRQTFMLDINEMEEKLNKLYNHRVIMKERRGNKVYYRYVNGNECLYDRSLTDEEVAQLQEVRSLMEGLSGLPRLDWLNVVAARFDQLSRTARQQVAGFESGPKRDERFIQPLLDAASNHYAMQLCYQKFDSEPTQRVVHPYYLKQYQLRWYLFCFDERRQHIACFALDRIVSLKRAEDVEFKATDVDFNHYFDDIIGVTKPSDGRVEHVRLYADHWVANYLKTSPLHSSQRVESEGAEGCVLTLDVRPNHELEQEVLFLGEHVVVLEPETLRNAIKERLENTVRKY